MNYFYDKENLNYGFTDLASERGRFDIELEGVEYKKRNSDGGIWEIISINTKRGENAVGKAIGTYYTLSCGRTDLLSENEAWDVQEEVARNLCEMCEKDHIFPGRILVVGLGNSALTPDTIGVKSALEVKPTLHIYNQEPAVFEELDTSEIAVCTPGVLSQTGIDSSEIVKSITKRISPDLVICIDALATKSPERLGTAIQMTNTGIVPGSGVGNRISAINYDTLGVPVFSIGLPTVINSRVFSGENDKYSKWNMLVAPREIDEICTKGAKIIGGAINQAFGITM